MIFINISKTNYLLINRLIYTTPDTEQIKNLILHFLIIQKLQKSYLYQVIPIWNRLPNSLKNCTSYSIDSKTDAKPPLSLPILAMFKLSMSNSSKLIYRCMFVSLSSSTFLRISSCPISHAILWADSNVTMSKLPANLLTKPSVFYYLANCIL